MNMPDKRSDADIVQAVLEGEIDAFEVLVQRYQKKVYNTVLRLAGHAAEAEDLSQEVFLKLYRGLSSFRGESSFSTYLYRIAANTAIDALRRASPQAISLSAEDEEGEPYELALSDGEPLPLELLEREERTAAIREAIDALPPHHRAVIVLREIEGMSYQEIARVLSVEEGTVKSRINRARAGLRELLFRGNYCKGYTTKEAKTEKEVQRA
ncbi:MAG: sigma-70 family RNA polymerase sigma factor [Clostridia bacterium]|nr:sigma-70 family RNA polymerase sigma factor [Clostridia bacterium]